MAALADSGYFELSSHVFLVLFSEQNSLPVHSLRCPRYKVRMEPLIVIAIFLLGASVGSLITTIRYRNELAQLRAQLDRIQQWTEQKDKEAA